MGLLRWAVHLRLTLEALEDFGISTDDIEISLSPDAFMKMLKDVDFCRAMGTGNKRRLADVQFVARDLTTNAEQTSTAPSDIPGEN